MTGTYDGSTMRLYINGSLVASKAATGTYKEPVNNTVMMLGANPNGSTAENEFMDGKIYNARVYNRALTQAEIQKNITAENLTSDRIYKQTKSVTVYLNDDLAGLETGAELKYGWSTSYTTAPTSWETASITTYSSGAKSTSFTATATGLTGRYYLWVKPVTLKDVAGNSVNTSLYTKLPKLFYLDNTAPTITIETSGDGDMLSAADITAANYGGYVMNYNPSNGMVGAYQDMENRNRLENIAFGWRKYIFNS